MRILIKQKSLRKPRASRPRSQESDPKKFPPRKNKKTKSND